MPLATGASLLAWSMVEFPNGFRAAGAYDSSADNVIAAGTYILNNLDTTTDPNNPVFIAQVHARSCAAFRVRRLAESRVELGGQQPLFHGCVCDLRPLGYDSQC